MSREKNTDLEFLSLPTLPVSVKNNKCRTRLKIHSVWMDMRKETVSKAVTK
jgi:hypothetical protein